MTSPERLREEPAKPHLRHLRLRSYVGLYDLSKPALEIPTHRAHWALRKAGPALNACRMPRMA